jgi:hypothetical protein
MEKRSSEPVEKSMRGTSFGFGSLRIRAALCNLSTDGRTFEVTLEEDTPAAEGSRKNGLDILPGSIHFRLCIDCMLATLELRCSQSKI